MLLTTIAMALATPAQTARQQAYDTAQAAYDKGDWAAAEAGFARLLMPTGRSSRTDGILRARYAAALSALDRTDEAIEQTRRALSEFPSGAPDDERAIVAEHYGNLLQSVYRLGDATTAYEAARDATPAGSQSHANAATLAVRAATVFDPARAIAIADSLMADPSYAALSKEGQALLLSLKARAQLNAGNIKEAKQSIAKAVAMTGSVGTGNIKVNLLQATVRGDAALIYAKAGDADRAKEYLAYSGGGYLPQTGWWGEGNRQPPVCDDVVRPDDVAVVAFVLDEQGKPIGADTVYASRPGAMGPRFAEAVRDWDPSPTVGKLSPFWRSSLRIEMRCVMRPAPIAIADEFLKSSRQWWRARHIEDPNLPGPRPRDPKDAKTDLAKSLADPLAARLRAIGSAKMGGVQTAVAMDEAMVAAGAPAAARAVMAYGKATSGTDRSDETLAILMAAADRLGEADNRAAGRWLLTEAALAEEKRGKLASARSIFERLSGSSAAAAADDPIRMLATLHLSIIDQKQGAATAARDRLKASGLDAEQCSLFDVRPLPVNQSTPGSVMMPEVAAWGFDGFASEAFDIGADGRVTNVRTVMAYPPFVFGKVSEQTVAHFRYLPPTLDGKVLGCASKTFPLRYRSAR